MIAGEFVDRGVSGMATIRPALDQLWAAAVGLSNLYAAIQRAISALGPRE